MTRQQKNYWSLCGLWPDQILIELETALLDDKPHWYPLQTHDVSSIPLPRPSPYLPRRLTEPHGKKLQRKSAGAFLLYMFMHNMCVRYPVE